MGTGLVGTALFLGILICWCRRFWRARHLLSSLPIAQGAMIALFVRVWPFASTTSFFTSWGGFTFWWMAAWVLASIAEVEEKN